MTTLSGQHNAEAIRLAGIRAKIGNLHRYHADRSGELGRFQLNRQKLQKELESLHSAVEAAIKARDEALARVDKINRELAEESPRLIKARHDLAVAEGTAIDTRDAIKALEAVSSAGTMTVSDAERVHDAMAVVYGVICRLFEARNGLEQAEIDQRTSLSRLRNSLPTRQAALRDADSALEQATAALSEAQTNNTRRIAELDVLIAGAEQNIASASQEIASLKTQLP